MPKKEYYDKHREECVKKAIEWNEENIDKHRKHGRTYYWNNREKQREYKREYQQRPEVKERRRQKLREWRAKHPKSNSSHHLVNRYIKLGIECELCPEDDKHTKNLLGHHPDYDYPEIVVTTCHQCHQWI